MFAQISLPFSPILATFFTGALWRKSRDAILFLGDHVAYKLFHSPVKGGWSSCNNIITATSAVKRVVDIVAGQPTFTSLLVEMFAAPLARKRVSCDRSSGYRRGFLWAASGLLSLIVSQGATLSPPPTRLDVLGWSPFVCGHTPGVVARGGALQGGVISTTAMRGLDYRR